MLAKTRSFCIVLLNVFKNHHVFSKFRNLNGDNEAHNQKLIDMDQTPKNQTSKTLRTSCDFGKSFLVFARSFFGFSQVFLFSSGYFGFLGRNLKIIDVFLVFSLI